MSPGQAGPAPAREAAAEPGPAGRDAVERHLAEAFGALEDHPGQSAGPDRAGPDRTGPDRAGADPVRDGSALTGQRALELFDAQMASRHLDLAARWLRARDAGYYTIGSSGHEGNAGVAAALRITDPALAHYRSGAFYLARCQQASPPRDGVRDVLLGLVAAADEPSAGGLAFALDRAARLGRPAPWPADAIVMAGIGDASFNHSTAAGAINAAAY